MLMREQVCQSLPEVLKADGPEVDLLVTLVTAFPEEWPCKCRRVLLPTLAPVIIAA